ncbi:hypothetical protein SARC_01370 [Sphaeroforma arctica JP610]|uniref:Uncharacterized protein n=1 Tax=Sphaeroforma arctica JP610 TaxID=667725 RepID=A0A0L0GC55_9EUKA|nr:hypothetical protein SARC_01370 [Sphaeroforma arctica JP610]KNC86499.1 hypothetical protein SARC_01370 [Sphaeroforma arctica JP610]|eukprot:XP_014160401.1 hypothetical protein SARC_01370 [Sphaeroforma arctica JP610]
MPSHNDNPRLKLSLWNPMEPTDTKDCQINIAIPGVTNDNQHQAATFTTLGREEKKLIASHLDSLVHAYQEEYVEHMATYEYATVPKSKAQDIDAGLYVDTEFDDHVGMCPNHQPGLVKARDTTGDKARYCFGGSSLPGERVCDAGIPDFASPAEVHGDDNYSTVQLYEKTFAYHANYYMSTFSRELLDGVSEMSDRDAITISTQGTWNRIENVVSLSKRWKGPISFALLLDGREQLAELEALVASNEHIAKYVDFHVVWRMDHHHTDTDAFYPINLLRNMALHPVITSHVFIIDVDNIPNAPHDRYLEWIESAEESTQVKDIDSKSACPGLHAFVPPAVEMNAEALAAMYSENESDDTITKSQVVDGFFDGRVSPMHLYFSPAYIPTNHYTWAESTEVDLLPYLTRFEPYYVARMPIPVFNDTFVNRGGNFAQQMYEMAAGGYSLHRLPEAFIVDIPHTKETAVDKTEPNAPDTPDATEATVEVEVEVEPSANEVVLAKQVLGGEGLNGNTAQPTIEEHKYASVTDAQNTVEKENPQKSNADEETTAVEENMTQQAHMDENFVATMWDNFHAYVVHRYRFNMPTPQTGDPQFRTYRRSQEKAIEALWHMLGSKESIQTT